MRTAKSVTPLLVRLVSNSLMPLAAILCGLFGLAAQVPPATTAPAPGSKTLRQDMHPGSEHPQAPTTEALPSQWPVNQKPVQASVLWNSHGLRIEAQNSSLQQILQDVAAATGAKVEGMSIDERVFGIYGPGEARDVLSQLLQGSGYNILMIGGQGKGALREIVLSARPTGPAPTPVKTAQASPDEQDMEPEAPLRSAPEILQHLRELHQAQQPPTSQNKN